MREAVDTWDRIRNAKGKKAEREYFHETVNGYLSKSSMSSMFGQSLLPRPKDSSHSFKLTYEQLAKIRPAPILEFIESTGKGMADLVISPSNLLNALWIQFARAIAGNKHFRQCPSCKSWFEVSPERRRADAQYCREACRIRAYKLRKKSARELFEAGKSHKEIAKELGTTVNIVKGWITPLEPRTLGGLDSPGSVGR